MKQTIPNKVEKKQELQINQVDQKNQKNIINNH